MAPQPHKGASPHWEQIWSGGLGKGASFDVGGVSAALSSELSRVPAPPPGAAALVPGCGRAYDALALAAHGFDRVVAVDVAPSAVAAARAELGGDPLGARVDVVRGDFFELPESGQKYDFIWDCTFLCALDPSARKRWAETQKALLAPGGTLVTCVFPICDKVGGPPYAMSVPLVTDLLGPAGLRAARTHECAPSERHNPGGIGREDLGGPGTTLVAWQHAAAP